MGSLPSLMPRLRQGPGGAGRIDRLGWKAGTCFDAYGLRVGVRTNAPVLLEQLELLVYPGLFMEEPAYYADYVLPVPSVLEIDTIYQTPVDRARAAGFTMARTEAVLAQLRFLDDRNRARR